MNWTGPTTVIDWDLDSVPLQLSPSVYYQDATHFYLWVTNGSNVVTRYESADGENWGSPQVVNLDDTVWHLSVNYIPSKSEYWMLTVSTSSSGALQWATSKDGLNWTSYPGKTVMRSRPAMWDENLYRGAFLYDDATDVLEIWYSAYEAGPTWHTGYVSTDYSDFVAELEASEAGWSKRGSSNGTWSNSAGQVKRGDFSGRLVQSSSTSGDKMIVYKPEPLLNKLVLEWDFYDDLDDTAMAMVRVNKGDFTAQVGLGVWTGDSSPDSTTHYAFHDKSYTYTSTAATRSVGWNKLGLSVGEDSSVEFFVNDASVGTLAGQFADAGKVSIEGYYGGTTTFYVDDLRIRKQATTDPSIGTPGPEETGFWWDVY